MKHHALLLLAATLTLLAATPAEQHTNLDTPPPPDLHTTYTTMSAALATYYADQANTTLDTFLTQNADHTSLLLGEPSNLLDIDIGDTAALTERLHTSPTRLGTDNLQQLHTNLQADLHADQARIENVIAAAGANKANQLSQLRTPTLSQPDNPTPATPTLPQEALAFGLMYDASVTSLIAQHPDVFSQVERSGLASEQAQQAWDQSMLDAFDTTQRDLGSNLTDPCITSALAITASGDPTAPQRILGDNADCDGRCQALGMYWNTTMHNLLADDSENDPLLPPSNPDNLQPWIADALGNHADPDPNTPTLPSQLRADTEDGGCTGAADPARDALTTTLPGIFSNLQN